MKPEITTKWTMKDVYKVFVATFIIEMIIFIFLNLLGIGDYLRHFSSNDYIKTLVLFGLYILQIAGMIIPLWYFAIRKQKITPLSFGFRWIGTFKTVAWVIMSYIFYLGLGFFLIVLFYNLGIDAFGFEPQQSIFDIFGNHIPGLIATFVIAVILAPLVEEIYFRGFVLQTLAKVVSPFWGVVLTALIFAAVHFQFRSIMPLLILSLILNILYLRTKSIWPGIVFHIFNNFIALTIMYLFENQYWL